MDKEDINETPFATRSSISYCTKMVCGIEYAPDDFAKSHVRNVSVFKITVLSLHRFRNHLHVSAQRAHPTSRKHLETRTGSCNETQVEEVSFALDTIVYPGMYSSGGSCTYRPIRKEPSRFYNIRLQQLSYGVPWPE